MLAHVHIVKTSSCDRINISYRFHDGQGGLQWSLLVLAPTRNGHGSLMEGCNPVDAKFEA